MVVELVSEEESCRSSGSGLRFGLSLSEERNWSLPKSAKISVGWSLPYTDQSKVSRNMND